MYFQVTTQQADAADEAAISGVCELALREEGRLDVFFANVTSFFQLCSFIFTDMWLVIRRVLPRRIPWQTLQWKPL